MNAFIAQIMLFAGNFAPLNWAFCNGQMMSISQYQALFALIGTTYGGDGRATFALPNLQCRFPMHPGSAAGFDSVLLGEFDGAQAVSLLRSNLPAHSHPLNISSAAGYLSDPTGALLAQPNTSADPRSAGISTGAYVPAASGITGQAAPIAVGTTGTNVPVSILPPYLAINFIICLVGIFSTRS